MKYFYKIGIYTYGMDVYYIDLAHSKKITKEGLNETIGKATVKAIEIAKKEDRYVRKFEDVFDIIIRVLVAEYGFEPLRYELVWDILEQSGLFEKNGENDTSNNGKMLRKYLKENLQ